MQNKVVVIIAFLLIAGGMAYFLIQNQSGPASVSDLSPRTTDDLPTPIPNLPDSSPLSNPSIEALRVGGSSYLDAQGVYSFLYPSNYTLDSEENGKYVRVSKRGETQRPQSEMSDGALVVFESIDLGGQTLEEWVDTRIAESTANGMSEVLQPKQAVTHNTYPGFTYEVRGLGSSKYVVVQKSTDSNSAVSMTYLVADPEQRGYQQEVDAILATVELLK